ncbi:MAG: L,D-transpeptidase family protein [Chloroflexi bacterium]|nr:L,D-transpeptidase family protein [Chloroflexota bacterium]MBU1748845.1 L,D-transpeptidase family protein [Chloroflexota bacterium]
MIPTRKLASWGLVLLLLTTAACTTPQPVSPTAMPGPTRTSAPTQVAVQPSPTATATPSPTPTAAPTSTASPTPLPSFARPTESHPANPSPTPISTRGPVPSPTFGPDAQGRAIVIDQDTQTLTVYEGGYPLRVIPCSTGAPDTPTPPWTGVVGYYRPWFESFGTRVDDAWWIFRDWDGNYYIHGLPYTVENGVKVYQDREFLGRRPVSHGCIRISPEDIEWLTWWNPLGVPCTIKPMTRMNWE